MCGDRLDSIFAPNGSAPARYVNRAGAWAVSSNSRRRYSLSAA
jgi:hypothetical protein